MRGQLRRAVSASVRESRGRGGEREVANIAIIPVVGYPAVLVILLDLGCEEIDVVVQKFVRVQVVPRRLVGEKVVVVEIRGGEGI